MNDEKKTKAQLIKELKSLRKQLDAKSKPTPTSRTSMKSEEDYCALIANLPSAVWSSDSDGSNYYVSPNVKDIYGFTDKEVYAGGNDFWYSRVHPDDLERVRNAYETLWLDNKPFYIESRLKHKNGKWLWVSDKVSVHHKADGSRNLYGIFSDITERKETQFALAQSERKYRDLVTNMPSAVWSCKAEGEDYFVTENIKSIYGYTPQEIVKGGDKLWHGNIHPDDFDRVNAAYRTLMKKMKPMSIEYRLKRKGGRWIWISDKVNIYNDENNIPYTIGIFSDITERKETQIALAQSEQKYREMVTNMPSVIWRSDSDGSNYYVSPNIKDIYGFKDKDLYEGGRPFWYSRIHPDDFERVKTAYESLWSDNAPFYIEYKLRHKNGKWMWVSDKVSVRKNADGSQSVYGIFSDVTERVLAANELQKSQQNLKTLMDNTPAVVYRCVNDGNWTVDFVSKQIKQLTGYPSSDLLSGKVKWSDLLVPEDLHILEKIDAGVKSKGKRYNLEYRIITLNNKIKWVMEKGFGVYDESGRLDHIEGFAADITESKNIQLELQEKEEMIRQLTENINEVFWIAEPDWSKVHYISKAYKTIFGQPLKMVYKDPRSWRKLVLDDDRKKIISAIPKRFPEDMTVLDLPEYRIRRPNGSVRWIKSRVFPIHDQSGRVYRVAGISEDITERKEIAEQLHAGEKKYSQLIETMPDGLGVVDQDGMITFINKAFTEILGYSEQDVKGKHITMLLDDKGLERHESRRLEREKGIAETYYTNWRHIDGHLVPIVVRPAAIFDDEGNFKGSFGIFTDLTGQKKMQSELAQKETQYKTLYESSRDAIMILNPEMQFIDGNLATLNLFGCKNEKEFTGKRPIDFSPEIQPDGMSSVAKAKMLTEKVLREGSCLFEWQYKRPDGYAFMCSVLLTAMEIEGEKLMLATTRDITEQRKAQDAIKNLLDFENLITEVSTSFINLPVDRTDTGINIALGILSKFLKVDRSSVVLFSDGLSIANIVYEWCGKGIASRREEIRGFSTKNFKWWLSKLKKGKPVYMHSLDEFPKAAANEKDFFAAANVKSYVTVPIFFNKELIGFMNFYSIRDAKVWDLETVSLLKIVAEIFVNTIMRSRTQRELREYDAKMFRTEQLASLGAISANIAHELNQPLTVIQLLLQQVKRSLKKKTGDTSEVKENIEDSLSELTRAAEIVARFRTFARQSASSSIEKIDICNIAESLVKALSSGARKSSLKLSLKKPRNAVYVSATVADIEQLFFVLIQNSIQAAKPKQKKHLNITISCRKNKILINFKDDCGGVDKELAEKIFEPFFTTKPRYQGTGLGLPILQRIVSRYEGTIKYENRPGHGISFHISLPSS